MYIHVGSISDIVYRLLFFRKYTFLPNLFSYSLNSYFIHVHCSEYRIAVLHRHVFLAFLTAGSMSYSTFFL